MSQLSRRTFLKRTIATGGAAGALILSNGFRVKAYAANDRITLAQIGLGGRGQSVGRELSRRDDVDTAWVCDVDDERGGSFPDQLAAMQSFTPKRTRDMRHIFDDANVDAVVISTCDHWHALATVWACQAGKDVYVEKPPSNTIWEGRQMVKAARKYDRIVQVGTQNRSAPYVQEARDYIAQGNLGDIKIAKVFGMEPGGPHTMRANEPQPKTVDYDRWLGPAPSRPFNRDHFHDGWKLFWAYSGGDMTDDGIHQMDLARFLVGKAFPKSVQGVSGVYVFDDGREVPDTQSLVYEYDDMMLTFDLTQWAPYMRKTSAEIRNTDAFPQWDLNATRIELYGTKQKMVIGRHGGGWQAVNEAGEIVAQQFGRMADPEHQSKFVNSIRTRTPSNADIEEGHRSAVMVHAGNIVGRVGNRKITFDESGERFTDDEANALISRNYRAEYGVPEKV